jgi:hypothetical protein
MAKSSLLTADDDALLLIDHAVTGGSIEGHQRGVQRMLQAGAQSLTTVAYVPELQRDRARPTADDVAELFSEHGGGFGQGLPLEAAAGPEGRYTVAARAGGGSPPRPALRRKAETGAYHEGHRQGANGRREERFAG